MRLLSAISSFQKFGTVTVCLTMTGLLVFMRLRSIIPTYTSYSPGGSESARSRSVRLPSRVTSAR